MGLLPVLGPVCYTTTTGALLEHGEGGHGESGTVQGEVRNRPRWELGISGDSGITRIRVTWGGSVAVVNSLGFLQ